MLTATHYKCQQSSLKVLEMHPNLQLNIHITGKISTETAHAKINENKFIQIKYWKTLQPYWTLEVKVSFMCLQISI